MIVQLISWVAHRGPVFEMTCRTHHGQAVTLLCASEELVALICEHDWVLVEVEQRNTFGESVLWVVSATPVN